MSKPYWGLLFVLINTCTAAFASEIYPLNLNRSLVLDKHPQNLESYFVNFDSQKNNFEINIKYLQEKCNFLTDDDISVYKKQSLPKRKKAFKRRVKHICEYLENLSFDQKKTNKQDLELIYELDLYYQSYLNRAYNQKSTVGIWDKVKMFYTTFFKHYQVSKNPKLSVEKEARNLNTPKGKNLSDLNIDQIALLDPKESPYWQKMDKNPYKTFKKLQKNKKIKPEKELYVIFDEPSLDGSSPKFKALDLNLDDEWSIKWGDEIHSDVVGSRLFAALGFDVDHPYIYKKEKLKVIFPPYNPIHNAKKLSEKIFQV